MDKQTIEDIVDNMAVWDIVKLIEVLQDKFGNEPDYKGVNKLNINIDINAKKDNQTGGDKTK